MVKTKKNIKGKLNENLKPFARIKTNNPENLEFVSAINLIC